MSQPTPPAAQEPFPNLPLGPYPGMPAPEAPKKRSWFARHKILTTLGALVTLIIVISALSGGESATEPNAGTDTTAPAEAASEPAPAAEEPADEEPAAAGIGSPVRDGKFEFTVTAIEPGVPQVGSDEFGQKAQGQFVLVRLTIQNIGDEAQFFHGSFQKAFDAQGREFSADGGAAIYLEDSNSFLNEINPGNTVNGTLVFDMPLDAAIAKLELHDSLFSGGVTVTP